MTYNDAISKIITNNNIKVKRSSWKYGSISYDKRNKEIMFTNTEFEKEFSSIIIQKYYPSRSDIDAKDWSVVSK